ncbi:unnamed protein product [Closterium sp. Yama58-4]|nr:unnamed protein product [Closterium sp. Yama58-4]
METQLESLSTLCKKLLDATTLANSQTKVLMKHANTMYLRVEMAKQSAGQADPDFDESLSGDVAEAQDLVQSAMDALQSCQALLGPPNPDAESPPADVASPPNSRSAEEQHVDQQDNSYSQQPHPHQHEQQHHNNPNQNHKQSHQQQQNGDSNGDNAASSGGGGSAAPGAPGSAAAGAGSAGVPGPPVLPPMWMSPHGLAFWPRPGGNNTMHHPPPMGGSLGGRGSTGGMGSPAPPAPVPSAEGKEGVRGGANAWMPAGGGGTAGGGAGQHQGFEAPQKSHLGGEGGAQKSLPPSEGAQKAHAPPQHQGQHPVQRKGGAGNHPHAEGRGAAAAAAAAAAGAGTGGGGGTEEDGDDGAVLHKRPRMPSSKPSAPEMPMDGWEWRKYGQKVTLGQTYPRSYFRCAHKTTGSHPCPAKKWAERCNDNPFNWRIKYVGEHNHSKPPPRPVTITIIHDGPTQQSQAAERSEQQEACLGLAVSSDGLTTSKQQQQQLKQTEGERGGGDCGAVSATERADCEAHQADKREEADGSQAANLRNGAEKSGGGGNNAEADLKREEGAEAERAKAEGTGNPDRSGNGDGNVNGAGNGSGNAGGGSGTGGEELESQPSIDIKPRDAQSNPSAWASGLGSSSANDASGIGSSAGTSGNSSNPFPGYTGPLPSALMQGPLPTPMWMSSLPRDSPRILIGPGGARWPMGRDSPGQLQSLFNMLSPLNTARVFSDVAQAPLPSPIDLPEIKGE